MKWYKFRDTEEFKNADIIYTVNENGEEVEISSDKLQRMEVVDVKRIGYPAMFPRELEVTIRYKNTLNGGLSMGRLIYDNNDGYNFVSDNGIRYDLLEGKSLQGKTTSDLIFIILHYDECLFSAFNIKGDEEYVGWTYGAAEIKNEVDTIQEIVDHYENAHPEYVEYYKDKRRITKPMPLELKRMLDELETLSECGGIKTYYDKEGREMAEGGLDEYEYANSSLVFNLLSCCEEVASALLEEDIDHAEWLIKEYAKDLVE